MLCCGSAAASFRPPEPFTLPFKSPSLLRLNRSNARYSISCSSTPPPPPPPAAAAAAAPAGPVLKKRKRYRKLYPGESEGIVEEMRFVAMKLRNNGSSSGSGNEEGETEPPGGGNEDGGNTWIPSMDGFLKYLVDSSLVFGTLERIVDRSDDVAYAYFRKTGLERSASLSKDLEWFRKHRYVIPEPSSPGTTYAAYLNDLAERSAPLFLCHFYNIYFAHITGGQGIGKQVCAKLLEGRELEFYRWEGNVAELLKDVREKLNKLGEHWSRDEKNRCLIEASKSFRFLGQIIRLIILF